MALEATYNKDYNEERGGRRKEVKEDFTREAGIRLGPLEVGYRTVNKGTEVDERKKTVKGNVDRTFKIGFT